MTMGNPADPSKNVIFLFLDENEKQITEEGVFPDTNVWDVYRAEERTNERGEAVIVRYCRKYTDQEINNRKEQQKMSEMQAAAVLVAQFQAQSLPDAQALEAKALYDTFDDLVKAKYTAKKQGFKFREGDDLWKTAQDNVTFQAQYRPGQGTESLYTHIDEAHAGTQEDPIPAKANMEYEYGKYYSEGDAVYICERGGIVNPEELYGQKVVLQYLPSALIGQYFRLVS